MITSIIVAASKNNAIGKNNELLWHMPADLKFFRKTTSGHTVIMGRKTFESVGEALPKRRNIVITRQANFQADNIEVVNSLEEALAACEHEKEEIFIVGGAQIYEQAMSLTDRIYLTRINHDFQDADTFFPEINDEEWQLEEVEHHESDEKNPYDYSFYLYSKVKN
ncbi:MULTISPECIES: dihydrofolate reductase [Olivibacter]|jgi:dihydrofolate reductase|uniref:Dihydrofolate reductase n=2 Tax=Olivibacter TaxID=376469 RepID=A0ABV6HIS7_9SPHI|nr:MULTISPECIES: dihydrofolate reductase [Olivibacter]MDX3913484.1 dihydrofolate reductase [Pseudosphingobacterium sp.]QEL01625.1 dihydrofolate reductase [Olivibacter sp. LS-1]